VQIVECVTDETGRPMPHRLGYFEADRRLIQIKRQPIADVMLETLSHEISHLWDAHFVLELPDGEMRANARQTPIAQLLIDFEIAGGMAWLRREAKMFRKSA